MVVTVPLLIVAIWPIMTGHVLASNLTPLVPLGDANGAGYPFNGHWDKAGWTLFLGGMFIAGWSTYGFETAVCYTSELTNPGTDTFKAIFFSGILCLGHLHPGALHLPGRAGREGDARPERSTTARAWPGPWPACSARRAPSISSW